MLLTPHQKSHPITYNHYFIDTLRKVRNERNKDEYERILMNFFEVPSLGPTHLDRSKDLRMLLTALVQRTEPDMNRFASSEVLDCMEAYYKVALTRFIDDIAVEIIEVNLLALLHNLFSPLTVTAMADTLVTRIAGESEENRAQREQVKRQLVVLQNGLEICKRFIGVGIRDNTKISGWTMSTYGSTESDHGSESVIPEDDKPHPFDFRQLVEVTNEAPGEALEETPEEALGEAYSFAPLSSKKGKKKSKIAAQKAVFEFDN